jgi:hypothetical protein
MALADCCHLKCGCRSWSSWPPLRYTNEPSGSIVTADWRKMLNNHSLTQGCHSSMSSYFKKRWRIWVTSQYSGQAADKTTRVRLLVSLLVSISGEDLVGRGGVTLPSHEFQGAKLTTHFQLEPNLRMGRTTSPLYMRRILNLSIPYTHWGFPFFSSGFNSQTSIQPKFFS